MADYKEDEVRASIQQHRQALIVLNGNRERDRILFIVTTIAVALLFIIMAVAIGTAFFGLVVSLLVFFLLGIPSLIGWQRAEGKVNRIKLEINRLESQSIAAKKAALDNKSASTAKCSTCGANIIGAGVFCPSCGAKQ